MQWYLEEELEFSFTALVSVATAATTNIKMNVMTISSRNDWMSLPAGIVAPSEAAGWRIQRSRNDAKTEPPHCATIYIGTWKIHTRIRGLNFTQNFRARMMISIWRMSLIFGFHEFMILSTRGRRRILKGLSFYANWQVLVSPLTWVHGKCLAMAKASVTAGFMWAPEIWPTA